MSSNRGNGEHWKSLESLGISRKELALAEALQMEYDAFSQLKQEKHSHKHDSQDKPNETPLISFDEPVYGQLRNDRNNFKLMRGLSGSDPSLSYNCTSSTSHDNVTTSNSTSGRTSDRQPPSWLKGPMANDYVYIFSESDHDFFGELQGKSSNGTSCQDGDTSQKGSPPLPPRPVSRNSSEVQQSFKGSATSQKGSQPIDINLFTSSCDQSDSKLVENRIHRDSFEEINFDDINKAITKLNFKSTYEMELAKDSIKDIIQGQNILEKEHVRKPVARSNTLPPQLPPRTYLSSSGTQTSSSHKNHRASIDPSSLRQNRVHNGYELFEVSEERDEEVAAFCHMLNILRSSYPSTSHTNMGYVQSSVLSQNERYGHGTTLKVTVTSDRLPEPLTFTCHGDSIVDLLIHQTLCYTHEDLQNVDVNDFVLKLCGLEEFLQNKHPLGAHEYIQHCRKFDTDVQLQLMERKAIMKDLTRTDADDERLSTMNHHIHLQERPVKQTITRQALTLLFDTFHNEVDSFLLAEEDNQIKTERLVQSVMAICSALAAVETKEITNALNQLPPCSSRVNSKLQKDPSTLAKRENREKAVEALTAAILDLVEMYCASFNADFQTAVHGGRKHAPTQDACLLTSPLSFTIYATHRIPITWATSYEDFYLSCSLTHGGKELCSPIQTKRVPFVKYLFHVIIWDQLICFPIQINQLARESLLTVTLFAVPLPPPGNSSDGNKQRRNPEALGWVTTPLFNFRHILTCGRKLLGLWPATQGSGNAGSSTSNFSQPDSVILQVDFPTSSFEVKFTTPPPAEFSPKYQFSSLPGEDQRSLSNVMHKKSHFWLTDSDKKLLWEKRYYCHSERNSLPLVLASAPSWEWACLPDIYALLKQWTCMNSLDSLGLLHATFPDQELRHVAVQWMDTITDTELVDFLPQLVQALKYECYLDSPLVRFLLRRAMCDVRIAHFLFWLLKDALKDSQFSVRYQYLLAALLCCCGQGLREEFDRQSWLVNILTKLAQKVRDAPPSTRQAILREGLEEVKNFFGVNKLCRLPLSPSLLVKGINERGCSYFNSNAVPLKLSFINADPLGDNINVIFKCGDDLRQDMLTLQMIRIMNKIWIQEGLDMRMVMFRCFATGRGRGMVEMIPNAETLRKIQVEHGVTGSFKDRPLADWLQKYNTSDAEYEKAVENFIYSCAGCCVATYVLGICDRHNDNIMLKTSGHMFHIDFGKFLGHAQMFGNIKRDRAPFVFTSDMAYVINGGDKPSSRFHDFVDLCCQAYNLIRKHTHLFLNLLGLMLSCGIPELSDLEDLKYVYDALRPQDSEADATTYFTRLIESSLGSVATKLNFFIHNLAQMKFTGSSDRFVLSFAPKMYTIKTDGRIKDIFISRHQKIFNPNKVYTYVIEVKREGQHEVSTIRRTFEEFQELHNKLRLLFPSSKLPSFPSRFMISRPRGEAVADKRKEELNGYVWHLIHAAPEVAECELVYTFFHPLPRDDKSNTNSNIPKYPDAPCTLPAGKLGGEVKLSVSYKNDKLFIMVMHIRGLQPLQDGNDPDPYVKIYLLPDPQKTSKRKTKFARKTCNPTYNEMLIYDGIPKGDLQQRVIYLRVLSEEAFRENILLGETHIKLKDLDLTKEKIGWFQLGSTVSGTLA
ncbi:phosphatidylinositol 4-phosphate 3-kinase C2 domain-containing subunit beta [Protopterus annectens]|uniref:phosphatidylinositol 4-phosphate 3-kinase C2 domain-containing subunit beta n=1 Tax=Protopterus annectens TaxID=7888 RepID=UPI001CF9FE9F|nr:phosphatidylinositol 4-phosphate 3-kinase C2 domain-containing subunit beta [Protopterus annectens]